MDLFLGKYFSHYLFPNILEKKIIMGKGDKKSRKGKLFMGSFGNTRNSKTSKTVKSEKRKPEEKK